MLMCHNCERVVENVALNVKVVGNSPRKCPVLVHRETAHMRVIHICERLLSASYFAIPAQKKIGALGCPASQPLFPRMLFHCSRPPASSSLFFFLFMKTSLQVPPCLNLIKFLVCFSLSIIPNPDSLYFHPSLSVNQRRL